MENNNTKTLLNEGVIQNMFKTMFGKSFKSTIAAASEGLLNVALTKVIGGGKKFSVSALRKTPEYQKALIDLVNEASVVRHQISFDELSNLKNKDLAKKLVKDVQEGIEKEITNNAAAGKNLIDADVKTSYKNIENVRKQGGDVAVATKQYDIDVKLQTKAADAQKKLAGMTPQSVAQIKKLMKAEAKVTTGTGPTIAGTVGTNVVIKTMNGIYKMTKNQLKKFPGSIKKVVVNNKMLSTLAVAGLTAYAIYEFFPSTNNESIILTDENGNPIDDTTKVGGVWLPCVQQMIDSKEGKIVTNYSNGQVSVFIKTTEFPGGLNYYQDGKVMNTATKEMGKYVCNKGGTTTISEVVGRVLRERLLHEQGSEIDIDTMTKYVDDAVDDLDGFVVTYNLNNLINIITNLKGKKFQGKDALSEFLGLYKEEEGGDDFLSDVESVGVKTLGTKGILAKRQLLSILKGGGGNSQKTDTGGGNSGTTIIWDKDKKEDGGSTSTGGGGGKTGIYRDCENMDFPLPVGCRSTKIAEIQKCLGVVDDGKLGPKTMKAMEDNKYDTSRGLSKDVYDAILTNCGKKPDGLNLTSLAPTDLNPIIPPKVPVEPVFDENRLNQLLTNENLVKLRDGDVVKWKGPALEGNDYYILNQYLEKQGYVQKTQRETGNKDDEDVTMKYKWKLENSPK